MLGFANGTAHAEAAFGQGSGPIWLDDVRCIGNEKSIFDCPANSVGSHNCGHSDDVGVSCHSLIANGKFCLLDASSLTKHNHYLYLDGVW